MNYELLCPGEPGILLVLAEEELIAVDLNNEDMKMILLPYLASLHASAVTCSYHVSNVPKQLHESLKEAGLRQMQDFYSDRVIIFCIVHKNRIIYQVLI